jgi:hypothetical protein
MSWTLRTDIAAAERCYEGTDLHGYAFAYLQEFSDGSAGFWCAPGEQATLAKSVDEAKRLAAERGAFPYQVRAIDVDGKAHVSGMYGREDPGGPMDASKMLASALLRNIRAHDGYMNRGDPALVLNLDHKIVAVQIIAGDGTVLHEQRV